MKRVECLTLAKGLLVWVTVSLLGISSAAARYSGGTGTSEDPYQINDANDMNEIGAHPNDWDAYFVLTADIDMSGFEYTTALIAPDTDNSTSVFQGTVFSGIFDGNGHRITNFTVDTADVNNKFLGLFGSIDLGGLVKNLGLEDSNVTGGNDSHFLGGLVGYNRSSTINNCYTIGSVSGNTYLGGLVGFNYYGTINNCHSSGSVSGNDQLGGLVGIDNYGTIRNCHSSGSVSGDDRLGRLVGVSLNGSINNCYATGSVSGDDYLGGLVGENGGFISNCYGSVSVIGGVDSMFLGGLAGSNKGAITNCYGNGTVANGIGLGGLVGYNFYGTISNGYASGSVSGDDYLGGLVGYNEGLDGTSHCYFLETTGPDNGYGTSLTDAQMQQQNSFVGWDFVGETASGTSQIWQMPGGGGYPVLSSFNGYSPPVLSGEGTAASPYLVCDPNDLGAIYHYELGSPDALYRLEDDINLSDVNWSAATIPVFHGSFDGNGHTIRNLTVDGGGYLGLFGSVYDGAVKDLVLEDSNVTGGNYSRCLGCLVGYNYYGTISNCSTTGSVSGAAYSDMTDSSIGGLVGYNLYGTIINCYVTGSVSGGDNSTALGGLVGYSEHGIISNCYAAGSISGESNSEYLGGLVGHNYEYSTIVNCYATGTVSGGDSIGGLVGRNLGSSVSNCYATGNVTGLSSLGGLVGDPGYESCITRCYFLDTAGPDNGYGNPLTDAQMQQQSSFVGWDFVGETASGTSQIWQMPGGGGYPVLSSFNGYSPPVLSGEGTAASPYLVCDPNEFGAIYHYELGRPDVFYRLEDDIDLSDINWSAAPVPAFHGCLDGRGHTIRNLMIDGGGYLGLFGCMYNGMVKDLALEDCNVTGGQYSKYLGGLVGGNYYSTIKNCCATGTVNGWGASEYLGGLVGENHFGTISNCSAIGSFVGRYDAGGLVGRNSSGSVRNCCATASVIGIDNTGGLVGYNGYGIITNSYATGSVTGGANSEDAGGLVGENRLGTISNCYAAGIVSGNPYLGGLVGRETQGGSYTACFWDNTVNPGLTGIGNTTDPNVIAKTTGQMQTQSTYTSAGWDFVGETVNGPNDIWRLCEDGIDYPKLSIQFLLGDFVCPDGVDFVDYSFFSGRWGDTDCADANDCDRTDIDLSGAVDWGDVKMFCEHWLEGI